MYKRAKLEIDSRDGPITIMGWADDRGYWNGWSYVLMDKTNADLLAEKLEDVIIYDAKRDAYVEVYYKEYHESKDDIDRWAGFYSEELDERVYPIGSGSWTWTHEFTEGGI